MKFHDSLEGNHAEHAKGPTETLLHVSHVTPLGASENPHPETGEAVDVGKSWLEALKETIEEKPSLQRGELREPTPSTMRNVQKVGDVVSIAAARPTPRDPDERRLLNAGWTPLDGCGPRKLTIWAHPETGFYSSQEIALHCLDHLIAYPPTERSKA